MSSAKRARADLTEFALFPCLPTVMQTSILSYLYEKVYEVCYDREGKLAHSHPLRDINKCLRAHYIRVMHRRPVHLEIGGRQAIRYMDTISTHLNHITSPTRPISELHVVGRYHPDESYDMGSDSRFVWLPAKLTHYRPVSITFRYHYEYQQFIPRHFNQLLHGENTSQLTHVYVTSWQAQGPTDFMQYLYDINRFACELHPASPPLVFNDITPVPCASPECARERGRTQYMWPLDRNYRYVCSAGGDKCLHNKICHLCISEADRRCDNCDADYHRICLSDTCDKCGYRQCYVPDDIE